MEIKVYPKNKDFKYSTLREERLILRLLKGAVSLNELYNFIYDCSRESNYEPSYNILFDIREGEFSSDIDSISEFAFKLRKTSHILMKRKIVFLTKNVDQVVFSTLLENTHKRILFDVTTVSTLESALSFFNIEIYKWKKVKDHLKAMQYDKEFKKNILTNN